MGQIESALKKIIVRNKTTVTTSERTGRSRLLMTLNPTRIVHHRRRKELLTMVGGKRKLSFNVRAGDARDDFDDIFGFTVGVTPHKQDKPKLGPFLVYIIDSLTNMSFAANEHLLLRNIRGRHQNVYGIHGEAPPHPYGRNATRIR